MRYWDSSALVALLVNEPASARRQAQLTEDVDVLTWWASRVECASALNRLHREGTLDAPGLRMALQDLAQLADGLLEVQPTERVRAMAMRLLRVHPLRAADAFQLAACLTACGEDRAAMVFVCADERLCVAAEKEGLGLLA